MVPRLGTLITDHHPWKMRRVLDCTPGRQLIQDTRDGTGSLIPIPSKDQTPWDRLMVPAPYGCHLGIGSMMRAHPNTRVIRGPGRLTFHEGQTHGTVGGEWYEVVRSRNEVMNPIDAILSSLDKRFIQGLLAPIRAQTHGCKRHVLAIGASIISSSRASGIQAPP